MAEALAIKLEWEAHFGIRGRLEYIPTGENKIADLLSHSMIGDAVQLIEARWGFSHRVEIDSALVAHSLARVRSAIANDKG